MSGRGAAPSDTVQPQKTGEQRNQPSRKTPTAATSLPAITAFSCDTIFWFDTFWSGAGFCWSCPKGVGMGRQEGWGAGCACRKVGKKTSTLDSIVPLSVILSLPDLRKIADKQILQEFCPLFCPLLSSLFAAGSSWMQHGVWVIDYFPPALRTVILSVDGTMREGCSPLGVACTTLSTPFYTCSQCREHTAEFNLHCF